MGLERSVIACLCLPFALLATALPPRTAEACSPAPPVSGPVLTPPDATVGVPVNAQIVLEWDGSDLWSHTDQELAPSLRPVGGAEVTVALTRHSGWNRAVIVARSCLSRRTRPTRCSRAR